MSFPARFLCLLALACPLAAQDGLRIDWSQATPSQLLADAQSRADAHAGTSVPLARIQVRNMSADGTVELSGDACNIIFSFLGDVGGGGMSLYKVYYVAMQGSREPNINVGEDSNGGATTGNAMPALEALDVKGFLRNETSFAQKCPENGLRGPYSLNFSTGGAGVRVTMSNQNDPTRKVMFDPNNVKVVGTYGF